MSGAYPLVTKFRECVHNDTKYDVEANGRHDDEERHVIKETQRSNTELLWNKWYHL